MNPLIPKQNKIYIGAIILLLGLLITAPAVADFQSELGAPLITNFTA
jgi:hypothetical protein